MYELLSEENSCASRNQPYYFNSITRKCFLLKPDISQNFDEASRNCTFEYPKMLGVRGRLAQFTDMSDFHGFAASIGNLQYQVKK